VVWADHPVDALAEAAPGNTASAAALAAAIRPAVKRFIPLALLSGGTGSCHECGIRTSPGNRAGREAQLIALRCFT
jgi:hypothetical protein